MPLLFSTPVFNEAIIKALSWTLIHSLWQGMLLAMAAAGIVFFTKQKSPALRYNLLTGALLIFIVGITATFSVQFLNTIAVASTVKEMPALTLINIQPANAPLIAEHEFSMAARAIALFNANAGWIVLVWGLIIVLRCIQLTAGLYGVYQLKTSKTFSPGEYWNNRIIELSRQLRVNKRVQLLQSGIARVPAMVGHFKPVILFPAGMLASLQPAEVEAILLHELAHIRRKDYLVNVLQHIVEIIFFFNPAVRWVSSLVRSERENCCDDIAVSQTNNKRNYINALIAFEGLDTRFDPSLATAFPGEKNHLMSRVKRIIYNNNKTLNNMEKKFLAAGMIITSIFIFAFSSNSLEQKARHKNTLSQNADIPVIEKTLPHLEPLNDTIPELDVLNGSINTTVNGKQYKIVTDNDQVTELYVNGKRIPAEKMGAYKSVTDKILAKSKLDIAQSKEEMEAAHKEMEQAQKELAESEKDMAQAQLEMKKAQEAMEQDMEQAKKELEQSKIDMEGSKKEMEQAKKEIEQAKKEMEQDMLLAKKEMEQAKKDIAQSKKEMEQSRKEMERAQKDMIESKRIQEGVIDDFIKDNLIKDKSELSSYKLNSEELIINGVKQPAAIHKKFKDKFVKGKNWSMMYNN